MNDDTKQQEKRDEKGTMLMDQDGVRGSRAPRSLTEAKPHCTDERGRPVAMTADGDDAPDARSNPFLFHEPKPE